MFNIFDLDEDTVLHLDPSLDLRTTEEIEEDNDDATALVVRAVTGLPARPGTIR